MSKRNKRQQVKAETENKEILSVEEETEIEETLEKEEEEVKENLMFKLGKAAGKVVGGVKKVVTSKPAKIIGGVAIVGATLAAGYKLGKDGFPEIGMSDDDTDDFTNDDIDLDVTDTDIQDDVEAQADSEDN